MPEQQRSAKIALLRQAIASLKMALAGYEAELLRLEQQPTNERYIEFDITLATQEQVQQ